MLRVQTKPRGLRHSVLSGGGEQKSPRCMEEYDKHLRESISMSCGEEKVSVE